MFISRPIDSRAGKSGPKAVLVPHLRAQLMKAALTPKERAMEAVWKKLGLPEPDSNPEEDAEVDACAQAMWEDLFAGGEHSFTNPEHEAFLRDRGLEAAMADEEADKSGLTEEMMKKLAADAGLAPATQRNYRAYFTLFLVI